MKLNISFLLCCAIVFCGCESNVVVKDVEKENQIDFTKVTVERYPLPIKNIQKLQLESLSAIEFSTKEKKYDSVINFLETDTLLPIEKKREKILELKTEIGELNDLAFVKSYASLCHEKDNSVDVEKYNGEKGIPTAFIKTVSKAVGLIRWNTDFKNLFKDKGDSEGDVKGQNWGSGCLIGEDVFITAGHCFQPMPNDWVTPLKKGIPLGSKELAKFMNVVFNYQIDGRTNKLALDTVSYPIIELLEYKNGGIDYAIVRLGLDSKGRKPGKLFGMLKSVSPRYVNKGDTLCIVQHPAGLPKKIDSGPLHYFDENYLYYDQIDTQGGSSGAPVINYSSGLIEGIHVQGGCGTTKTGNSAVKMQGIEKYSKYIKI